MKLQYILSYNNGEDLKYYIKAMRECVEKLNGAIEDEELDWDDAYSVVSEVAENMYNYVKTIEIILSKG